MGAFSAALYVVLIVVPVGLISVVPRPPLSGGEEILRHIAQNRAVYVTELVSFVDLGLPAIVVFLALYALGAVVGVCSEVVALANSSSPPSLHTGLLYPSGRYEDAPPKRKGRPPQPQPRGSISTTRGRLGYGAEASGISR